MKKTVCTILALMLLAGGGVAALITEPSTVFYGKVIGTGGAQPFPVTDGTLGWIIRKADGSDLVLRVPLYSLKNGEFSYRLDVPHSALVYELDDTQGIPLPPALATNAHVSVTVDGVPAVFCGPSGASFAAGQATRAATYRLDLEISRVPDDSDGDGTPDWWEDKNGFDKQDVSDAAGDADGDGLSNLEEYLRGLNPRSDSRAPVLTSGTLLAYANCTTGVRLETEDVDSAPTNIVYVLRVPPANGVLRLRNGYASPSSPDMDLVPGSAFSQQDVDAGRLVFLHGGGNADPDVFVVSVSDEAHAESTGQVEVAFYQPPSTSPTTPKEERQFRSYLVGLTDKAVVWDETGAFAPVVLAAPSSGLTEQEYLSHYVPSYGDERGQMMTGGPKDDGLTGGMADDVLVGGTGVDTMTGGGGADHFIFDAGDIGADTITDFGPKDGDVIDLSGVLNGASGMVDDYLRFSSDGTNALLGVNLDGNGATFTNLVITLQGVKVAPHDAYDLVLRGHVLAGALQQPPRVSVTVADAEASENANNSGVFVLSRTGDLSHDLAVAIALGGSAANGIDYSALESTVTFAAGVREITLTVSPFADSIVEPPETVELVLQPGKEYVLHMAASASLTIADLQSVVGVDVLEGLATKEPLIPATILVTRSGQTANALLVRLNIGGSARNGSDYQYVSPFVSFAPGQTAVPVDLLPLAGGVLVGGSEVVLISVLDAEDYALADVSAARVILSERRDTLSDWQAREFSESTQTLAVFAASDFGSAGFKNLQRYAYGMDPRDPDKSLTPRVVLRNGRCCLDVFRNPGAVDVAFVVGVSTDLVNWDSSPGAVKKIVVPEHAETANVETYQAVMPVASTARLFMRVRLVWQP